MYNVHSLIISIFLALRLPAEIFERLCFQDELKMTVPPFCFVRYCLALSDAVDGTSEKPTEQNQQAFR